MKSPATAPRRLTVAAILTLTAVALTGCSAQAASTSSAAVSSAELASLQKTVNAATASPKFSAPGPQINAGTSLKGKSVLFMPVSTQVEYCAHVTNDLVALAKSLGMKATNFENSTGPAGWIQGVNQAINEKYSAIGMVCGIDPAAIAPQVAQSKAAGIPVIDFNLNDPSVPTPDTIAASTSLPDRSAMQLTVDQAVLAGKGKAVHILLLTSNENVPAPGMVAAAQAEQKKICPSCSTTVVNVPIADWGAKMQSTVSSNLISNPNITSVITVYDAAMPLVVPAVQASGRKDIKIFGFGGTTSSLELMAKPSSQIAGIVGTPGEEWSAYTTMDQIVRLLSGNKALPASAAVTPLRLWTPKNVSQLNTYQSASFVAKTYGDAFKELWGIK